VTVNVTVDSHACLLVCALYENKSDSNNKNTTQPKSAPLSQPSGPMPQGLSVETPDDLAAQETNPDEAAYTFTSAEDQLAQGYGYFALTQNAFIKKNVLHKGDE